VAIVTLGKETQKTTIVIPMAGLGQRFVDAGYERPKPFIDVQGRTMIEHVLDNLRVPNSRFILLMRDQHINAHPNLVAELKRRSEISIVPVDIHTEGTACTVLLAHRYLPADRPLMIANCDQIVDFDCARFIADCHERNLDGSILAFRDFERDPKWSFVRMGDDNLVTEVREKVAISDIATVGVYLFRRGQDFVNAAVDMIVRNDRVNNEFYVCPVYNYGIRAGMKVGVYEIPFKGMHGLGTPEDLELFLQLEKQH
jgi:NDP-sugar pyrophosphorylase family protein